MMFDKLHSVEASYEELMTLLAEPGCPGGPGRVSQSTPRR